MRSVIFTMCCQLRFCSKRSIHVVWQGDRQTVTHGQTGGQVGLYDYRHLPYLSSIEPKCKSWAECAVSCSWSRYPGLIHCRWWWWPWRWRRWRWRGRPRVCRAGTRARRRWSWCPASPCSARPAEACLCLPRPWLLFYYSVVYDVAFSVFYIYYAHHWSIGAESSSIDANE